MGIGFHFGEVKKFWRWIVVNPQQCEFTSYTSPFSNVSHALEMIKMIKFMLCILYHNLQKRKKRWQGRKMEESGSLMVLQWHCSKSAVIQLFWPLFIHILIVEFLLPQLYALLSNMPGSPCSLPPGSQHALPYCCLQGSIDVSSLRTLQCGSCPGHCRI